VSLYGASDIRADGLIVDHDRVDLSPQELKLLARMDAEAAVADPGLEDRLVAGRPGRLPWRPSSRYSIALLLVGILVTFLTIGISGWLALTGALMMTAALEWIAIALPESGARVWRRWKPGA
jgi:Protein of unknown function (DUF3040)